MKDSHHPNQTLSCKVVDFLDQLKAVDIASIDLFGKSSMADYLIIANGTSHRHIKSMAEKLKEFLHNNGLKGVNIEGLQLCDWILVDGGHIIIHLFRPEIRQFYNLEKMWGVDFNPPVIQENRL